MGKAIETKKKTKLSRHKKKGVDMTAYAGKVKAFQNVDGSAHQKKTR